MKKKLIFFLPNFSPGGAGKSILNMCKYLDKKKYDLYIISLNKNYYKIELKKYCKKIYEINSNKTFISFFKIVKILENFDKKNTTFISNINYANVLSIIFLKIFKSYKLIITERTPFQELNYFYSKSDFFKKKIIKYLIFILYKKADLVICNSKNNSVDLGNFIKKKCHYVYPIFPDKISKSRTFIIKSQKINILSIGRYSREKNFLNIIKSISLIDNKNIRLFLVGDGIEKDNLKNYIKKHRVRAKLIKYTNENEIKYLKKSHIFISSSDFEGFPNIVVQAINYSLPILSSESHGGINEILLNGKGGTFYNKKDIIDLSNKINHLIKNYKLSTKKTLRAKSQIKRFLPHISTKKFEYLLKKLDKHF